MSHGARLDALLDALNRLDPDEAEYAVRRTEEGYELIKTIGVVEGGWTTDEAEDREGEVEDCAAEALQELLHGRELARDEAKMRVREAERALKELKAEVDLCESAGVRKLLKEYGR